MDRKPISFASSYNPDRSTEYYGDYGEDDQVRHAWHAVMMAAWRSVVHRRSEYAL
jgi:hypothetical protein